MRWNVVVIVLLAFSQGLTVYGQSNMKLTGSVIDAVTGKQLPYCSVYNNQRTSGTVSDESGMFILEALSIGDTITVSFVGYESSFLVMTPNLRIAQVKLSPQRQLLNEMVVMGDNRFLYTLLSQAKQTHTRKVAKTYFSLLSWIGGTQVELVECYYNGVFHGADLVDLSLKQGRVALMAKDDRFFVSTETTKALNMLKLYKYNKHFPVGPLELSAKRLRKAYELSVASRYYQSDSTLVYVVNCVPNDPKKYFAAKVWIDQHHRVLKASLDIENAEVHPFKPHGKIEALEKVGLKIIKTFDEASDFRPLNTVFDYHFDGVHENSSRVSVTSKALVMPFDYQSTYDLPHFEHSSGMYEDYRKINALPTHHAFWENVPFKTKELTDKNGLFMKNATITGEELFVSNAHFTNGMFEHSYRHWSDNRIYFKATEDLTKYREDLPANRYSFEVQVYMDVEELKDSLSIISRAVFDPYKSFYRFEETPSGLAFINIYFDLVEITRQRFMKESKWCKTREEVEVHYSLMKVALDKELKAYCRAVSRGENIKELTKWNEKVYNALEIDNMFLFKVE